MQFGKTGGCEHSMAETESRTMIVRMPSTKHPGLMFASSAVRDYVSHPSELDRIIGAEKFMGQPGMCVNLERTVRRTQYMIRDCVRVCASHDALSEVTIVNNSQTSSDHLIRRGVSFEPEIQWLYTLGFRLPILCRISYF